MSNLKLNTLKDSLDIKISLIGNVEGVVKGQILES